MKPMNIAIASDDGTHVAEHPGRCGGFVIFEVNRSAAVRVGYRSNTCRAAVETSGIREDESAASDLSYQSLVLALTDCRALVSRCVDGPLLHALQGGIISSYVCGLPGVDLVDEAAQLFVRGQLRRVRVDSDGAGA